MLKAKNMHIAWILKGSESYSPLGKRLRSKLQLPHLDLSTPAPLLRLELGFQGRTTVLDGPLRSSTNGPAQAFWRRFGA